MTRQAETIKVQGGADYAQVAERVKLFWEANPRGKILTQRVETPIGNDPKEMTYRTYVWKDKKDYISDDLLSCDASAEASFVVTNKETKEKLETKSVGRALAYLGYAASGQIASSEEMEDYLANMEQEKEQYILDQIDIMNGCKTLEELKEAWTQTNRAEERIAEAKNERKKELEAKK